VTSPSGTMATSIGQDGAQYEENMGRPIVPLASLAFETADSQLSRSASGRSAGPVTSSASRPFPVWRDRLVIGLAYALSWGALVVNRGFYWDDWTLVGLSPTALVHGFWELGLPWIGYFYAALFSMPLPGLIGHVVVFWAYLLSTLALHAVLCRLPGLSRMDALVAALTFALLPVNYARIALIDLTYGLSLLAFLAATWLLIRYLEDGGLRHRLAALGLYLCSFTTASLLVLYVVPMVVAALIIGKSGRQPIQTAVLRHADFLCLPVAYWVLRSTFLAPSGVYEGYNALTPRGLAQVPGSMLSVPTQVLFEPLYRAVMVAGLLGVAAGVVAAIWLLRRSRVVEVGSFVSAPTLALIGAVVLGLGVLAYLAVGLVPTIWDWSSRHQLLVPLGAGLLAAAAARGVKGAARAGRAIGLVIVGMLLGISAVADARTLKAYQADWFKQAALIESARALPAMRAARHIRVIDSATAFNTLSRTYRFYEYNALFSEAMGDTRRLASLGGREPTREEIAQFIARPAYHMDQYVPSPVDLELQVSSDQGVPGGLQVLRLLVLEALGSPSFEHEVSRLIEVRATPVAGSSVGHYMEAVLATGTGPGHLFDGGDDLIDDPIDVFVEAEPERESYQPLAGGDGVLHVADRASDRSSVRR
jgi:hypothetical protein